MVTLNEFLEHSITFLVFAVITLFILIILSIDIFNHSDDFTWKTTVSVAAALSAVVFFGFIALGIRHAKLDIPDRKYNRLLSDKQYNQYDAPKYVMDYDQLNKRN
jgi:hypothetical protein